MEGEDVGDDKLSKKEEPGLRVLSVDKVTVEKIVFESSSGSREVLLTKNETSRKLSIKSELSRSEDEGRKNRASLPEDILAANSKGAIEKRIKPIKLTKGPSIGSIVVDVPSKLEINESNSKKAEEKAKDEDNQDDRRENEGTEAKDRLEKSRSNIKVLQENLTTKIDANTVERYRRKLQELRENCAHKLLDSNANEKFTEVAFDEEFLQKHNLDRRLKIEEDRSPEGELEQESDELLTKDTATAKPSYSKKVSEVEKRWSGEFLENRLTRRSSESSKSSYVEEFGSVSSEESVAGDRDSPRFEREKRNTEVEESGRESFGRQTSEEVLADSTVSTLDSDSCLEDRIKALEEEESVDRKDEVEDDEGEDLDVVRRRRRSKLLAYERADRWNESLKRAKVSSGCSTDSIDSTRSRKDGYASLVRELAMEAAAGTSRVKKEEKQKRKLGLRRLLPGFFSPKDSRKDYKKKKESKERRRHEDRHFARYQQNGNYTRSPDTMNLNEDIKRNVKLDNSLNGSIIEERLDEIKRELFPDQCPITSTPDHLARDEEQSLLRDRSGAARAYGIDSSLSSIAPDDRWNERSGHLGISPDIRKFEQRQKREEFDQRYGGQQLERKHSLQESNPPNRLCFFQRNHGPSGRISAPPSERYLVRPRAIHPIDRPLPAIPRSRVDSSNYENYPEEDNQPRPIGYERSGAYTADKAEYSNKSTLYENEGSPGGLILKSVSAQVKITRQPIGNQNQKRAPLVGRSPKYLSSGSSQKSGDYGDSSCTPNSSQKSEFSPTSSKSGEYYLNSPRNSGSPNDRDFDEENPSSREGIYENENENSPSRSSTRCADERIYDETPSSPSKPPIRSPMDDSLDKTDSSPGRGCSKGGRPMSPRTNADKQSIDGETGKTGARTVPSRRSQPNEQILIASPKREIAYECRIPRPLNESRLCAVESPVRMMNSPHRLTGVTPLEPRNQDPSGNREPPASKMIDYPGGGGGLTEIARPEPVYGHHRNQPVAGQNGGSQAEDERRKDCDDRVAWVQGRATSPATSPKRNEATSGERNESPVTENHRQGQNQPPSRSPRSVAPLLLQEAQRPRIAGREKLYGTAGPGRADPPRVLQPQAQQRQPRSPTPRSLTEPLYLRQIPESTYGQRENAAVGPLSPSKQETRQHLEAFYWQQKTLEASRKTVAPPSANANPRQIGRKIDLPEVREAVYWQQLKKLDEEQQRRIYEQNLMEESSCCKAGPKIPSARSVSQRQVSVPSPAGAMNLSLTIGYGEPGPWAGNVCRSKGNPSGKPPLMQSQKGPNQPVLIVRPQQAIRERREAAMPSKPVDSSRRPETQRSKSASPHFHRGDAPQIVPRKLDAPSIYEEEVAAVNDVEGKSAPPPIFKRGSLIGGESAEYGTGGGAKRVSFSNQSTTVGRDLPSGSWPTKHGTAPEPPTRRHRSEDSVSDTDSVFLHQERRDAAAGPCPDVEYDADRPLPPLPNDVAPANPSGSGSTPRSNAYGEVRWNPPRPDPRRAISPHRMLRPKEEEWNSDGKGRQSNDIGGSGRGEGEAGSNEIPGGRRGGGGGGGIGVGGGGSVLGVGGGGGGGGSGGGGPGGRSGSVGGGRSRDEPRRHTLSGDHQPSLHHQQFNAAQQLHPLHPHHLPPPHGQYGTPPTRHTTMDLEMGTKSRQRKSPLPRGYPPPSSTMLLDEDPGIMSEVETSSTGFRRGGKQRSSLPVVRNPSKTLERPLGLVFLQYRNETKRALLPNEITSIDTVKALFVRSFPKQLTMEYLDSPHVKVYIHDSNKDMFYELEDLRSHLRDIRDRSVLRLFESTDGVTGMSGPLGIPGTGAGLPPHWEDQSYFSEPEFDSEYQHQHIHKSKTAKNSTSGSSGYYVGGSSTLPRGGPVMRAYSPAASSVVGPSSTPTQPKPLTTPERDRHKPTPPPKPAALVAGQYVYRDLALTPEMYNQLRGLQKKAKDLRQEVRNLRRMSQAQAHTIRETILDTFITIRAMLLSCGDAAWDAEKIRLSREEDLYRQEMLRLVKDLTELENTVEELRGNVINRKTRVNMSDVENMALIMSKSSLSRFSKTVADLKVRFPSLQEGMKGLLSSEMEMVVRAEKFLKEEPERLESALKRCKKLTSTLVTLKRLASVQEQRLPNAATSVDAEETPPITPTSAQHSKATAPVPAERTVVGSASVIGGGPHALEPPAAHQQRPENALDALLDELQTFSRPSSQLGHVQTSVRGEAPAGAVTTNVGTPARAPCISDIGRKGSIDSSSGTVIAALAPTGAAANVAGGTLRRLHSYPSSSDTDTSPPIARLQVSLQDQQPSLPTLPQGFVPGQKPPVPERNAELLQLATARRVPPPPPPRTSSRSPLASPTSPQLPPRNHSCNLQTGNATLRRPPARGTLPIKEGKPPMALPAEAVSALDARPSLLHNNGSTGSQTLAVLSTSNSSSCESVNSQEGLQIEKERQEQLDQRHQELLRKQKALQEQYARLQQLQRNTAGLTTVPPAPPDLLKKTGSESNLLAKMGLGLSAASSGSLTSLAGKPIAPIPQEATRAEQPGDQRNTASVNSSTSIRIATTATASTESNGADQVPNSAAISNGAASATTAPVTATPSTTTTTTSKIYETDIL
nr:uncharacterized protein LOC117606476 isoform X15 [Osmia lignaria]